MNTKYWAIACIALLLETASVSHAQDPASWVLIKKAENSRTAKGHARLWALQVDGVHALRDRLGQYSVAIGPFEFDEAQRLIRQWKETGQVPEDSLLASSADFAEVIWPPGASGLLRDDSAAEQRPSSNEVTPVEASVIEEIALEPETETLEQAMERESLLSAIQVALSWFGLYDGGIDGQFGPATRQAIQDYQSQSEQPPTGYLTAFQQDTLLNEYRQNLVKVGFYSYSDANAGVKMMIPGALVEFARYSPPFAVFESSDERDIKLMIVSLRGGSSFLKHLFEVVQMFNAVPPGADKSIGRTSFQISGRGETSSAYATANLSNGRIKGFLATWPTAENELMDRVLPIIRSNFRVSSDNTLDDLAEGGFVSDAVDLLAGMESRKPDENSSGFFFDSFGHVLTTRQAVSNCDLIRIGSEHDMILSESGPGPVAVLAPVSELSPIEYAKFATQSPRFGESVSVSGFSFGGRLGAPTLTKGMIKNATGPAEDEQIGSISVDALEGDAGGPILNSAGAVVGILLPGEIGGRQLPDGEFLYSGNGALDSLAAAAGRKLNFDSGVAELGPNAISRLASDITVLVECYR